VKALSGTASGVRHAFGALSEALIVAAIIGALVFGYAAVSGTGPLGASDTFAAKGGNGNGHGGSAQGGTTSASCVIGPSAVQAWQEWTVTATGLPTGGIVDGKPVGAQVHIQIDDGVGGTGWSFFTPDGTYSYNGHSSAAGTTTVQFSDWSNGSPKFLTSCTTSVY
jgi:hypothetical protein